MSTETSPSQSLEEHGYALLPGFMPPELLHGVRTCVTELLQLEGADAGNEFKQEPGARRLANLVNKGEIFQQLIAEPRVLGLVSAVLGDAFKLSSLNARSAEPHNDAQPLHCDMGAIPDEQGYWVCNVVWMLDDFTEDNGALRVVPGSHKSGQLPQEALEDPFAPHPDEVTVTGEAGSIVVMNAHLWHGGKANSTDQPRLAVHTFYCRRDKPQQQYQKQLLSPTVQASLPTHLRDMLALDDPLNDEISAAPTRRSGFLK